MLCHKKVSTYCFHLSHFKTGLDCHIGDTERSLKKSYHSVTEVSLNYNHAAFIGIPDYVL